MHCFSIHTSSVNPCFTITYTHYTLYVMVNIDICNGGCLPLHIRTITYTICNGEHFLSKPPLHITITYSHITITYIWLKNMRQWHIALHITITYTHHYISHCIYIYSTLPLHIRTRSDLTVSRGCCICNGVICNAYM